jgi:hypothetical protein
MPIEHTARELGSYYGRLGTWAKYRGIEIRVRCEDATPEFGHVRYTLRQICEACGHEGGALFRTESQHVTFDAAPEGGE